MRAQWGSVVFWLAAILAVVIATVVYQPAAARTGSLLVWTRERIYIMDIDTLNLERVGPVASNGLVVPSPGCFRQIQAPCWVAIDAVVYQIEFAAGGNNITAIPLPVDTNFRWAGTAASWSPDGVHYAYFVASTENQPAELNVYNVATRRLIIKAPEADPTIAVAWTADCARGVVASGCKLGYKKLPASAESQALPVLASYTPATNEVHQWAIAPEKIFELRWSPTGVLLYSRPKRHFLTVQDHTPAYQLPPGARLANMSPDGYYTVYYQPFKLKDCQPPETAASDACLHLGVWLAQPDAEHKLIYSVDLSQAEQTGGLNFVPTWSPSGRAFVFFQGGRLIHYDLEKGEATIWYKPLPGKLRSIPVFSSNEDAVAFVDDQGQGLSDYRLLVINPKLEPIDHVIQAEKGFKVLAWLPAQ
jgi:hypothetical protein